MLIKDFSDLQAYMSKSLDCFLDMQLLFFLKQNLVFSGNILVTSKDKILTSKNIGFSDYENETPFNSDAQLCICSLSKQFTAAAIALLHHKKKLSFFDHAVKYFPFLDKSIQIHHLLTHSSGLPEASALKDYTQVFSHDALFKFVETKLKNAPLAFKPGEKFAYNDFGYLLLAILIEKATNKSYADFLATDIFIPAELTNTNVIDLFNKKYPKTCGYSCPKSKLIPLGKNKLHNFVGTANIYSSVEDLAKWNKFLTTDPLWHMISKSYLFKPHIFADNFIKNSFYGYGWFVTNFMGFRCLNHFGRLEGFHSGIINFDEIDLQIIVLSNVEQAPVEIIASMIAFYFLNNETSCQSFQEIGLQHSFILRNELAPYEK